MKINTYFVSTTQGNISIWDTKNEGDPVLFIHGNSACKEVFFKQFVSELGKKYRLLAIDLPGHGESNRANDPEKTYTIPGYADVILEVIEKLDLQNLVIVGWSLGGHIALCVLEKYNKIKGLLITGTPPITISREGFQKGFNPLPLFETLFNKIEFSTEEATEFMSASGIDVKTDPFIVEAALNSDGRARHYLVESMFKERGGDQKKIVETNSTPLCIIQGEKDLGINNAYIESLNYKNLFNQKVYIAKNSGHSVFWQDPSFFNQILSEFLLLRD